MRGIYWLCLLGGFVLGAFLGPMVLGALGIGKAG